MSDLRNKLDTANTKIPKWSEERRNMLLEIIAECLVLQSERERSWVDKVKDGVK